MLVSIIVPVYNVDLENFKVCLNSLKNQTLKDIEILLVDDRGEMRDCVEYAKQIAETDPRVKILVNETNSGAGYSRNRGIAEAKGEYLAFVDADDWVDEDFFEKLYEKSKEKKYDIIKGELEGETTSLNEKIREGLMLGKPLYELFKYHHWTAIYRGEFLKKYEIGYGRSRVSQDVTFLLQVSVQARSFAMVDGVYYHYDRDNSNSLTHTSLVENISHYCQAIQERMDYLTKHADYNDPAFLRYVKFNTDRLSARVKMLKESDVTSDNYKVSVIVPTYNSEEYLPDLIAQLKAQTLQDIEIIFVDDGSTDGSGDIIEKAMQEDNRISYYYQSNSGAGMARNTGLNHAKGKYVICIDADDLYDGNMLEELYHAAEENKADVVMCLFRRYNYWTNVQTEDEGFKKDKLPMENVFCGKDVPRFLEWFNPGPINKLYRRKFVMENGIRYSATRIANDVMFGYGAMLLAERIYCLPKNLLTVRRYVNENSISSTRQMYLDQSVLAMDGLWTFVKKRELLDNRTKKQLAKIFVNTSLYNCQYGDHEEFMNACRRFIKRMCAEGVAINDIQKMYNIDTGKFVKRIEELKQNPDTDKEVVMLENKIVFIKKIKKVVKSIKIQNSPFLSLVRNIWWKIRRVLSRIKGFVLRRGKKV